jgi:hypothetical protein
MRRKKLMALDMCKKYIVFFYFCQYDLCRSKYEGSEPFDYFEKGSKTGQIPKFGKFGRHIFNT